MAVQNPFFGKREPESFQPRSSTTSGSVLGSNAVNNSAASAQPVPPAAAPKPSSASDSSGSKLTVGPNIKLKGVEITDCDTLVVEGTVEATIGVPAPTGRLYANEVLDHAYTRYNVTEEAKKEIDPLLQKQAH